MDFKTFILTYEGVLSDGKVGILANIPDYYDNYVSKFHKSFSEFKLSANKLVICPLHSDTDPSMGLINHKFLRKVKIFHCFGCHASGDLVRLHQRIVHKYENRTISERDSCIELANIFNIPYDEYKEESIEDYEQRYFNTIKRLDSLKNRYTESDFKYDCIKSRQQDRDNVLAYLNSSCVKLIATKKNLYTS